MYIWVQNFQGTLTNQLQDVTIRFMALEMHLLEPDGASYDGDTQAGHRICSNTPCNLSCLGTKSSALVCTVSDDNCSSSAKLFRVCLKRALQ